MKKRPWLIGILVTIILVVSVACSTSPENGKGEAVSRDGYTTPATTRATTTTTAFATTMPIPAPTITFTQSAPGEYGSMSGEDAAVQAPTDRMIVRNGNMSIVVEDVDTSLRQIEQLADTYHGWVVSSNAWQNGDRMVGSVTIRVEAQYFDAALGAIRTLAADIRSESTSGYDVTEEYVDLGAQLETLQTSADQLEALMEKAGTVEQILKVQQQLTQTNTQIEQIKGRMQYLEQSAATSSIAVDLEQSKLSVEFNASARTVKEGEEITFMPKVSGGFGPYSYQWDFGDGRTSTEEVPSHTYRNDGTYTVTLTLTDDRGTVAQQTREDYINVLAGWRAGGTVNSAVNGLVAFGRVLVNILIWLGIFSPLWLVIGGFVWWLRRRRKASPPGES
jgi:molybdopterin converting factor small subunit